MANDLLRPGLLTGVSVLVAGAPATAPARRSVESADPQPDTFAAAVADGCATLGARVSSCSPAADDEAAIDAAVSAAMDAAGGIDLLAVDAAGLFAHGAADGGHAALRACMDSAWNVTRAVVNHAFIGASEMAEDEATAGGAAGAGGRVVYLAPPTRMGAHAGAATAGLENLARTLSIEWARRGITTVTIALGASTSADEAATLVAYLASPAGAYFSGCLLDLRGV